MSIQMYFQNPAPKNVGSAAAGSGGSGWGAGPYSFLIVAWYSADETDVYAAGAWNFGLNDAGTTPFEFETHAAINGYAPSGASARITVSWDLVTPTPHHYSVYWQESAEYDLTDVGFKHNDTDISPEGNLTATRSSYEITSPTEITDTTDVYMCHVDSGNKIVRIDGNHVLNFGVGTIAQADPIGAAQNWTVEYSQLYYSARGPQTEITLTSGADFTGVVVGEDLRYRPARQTFASPSVGGVERPWGLARSYVAISPVKQMTPRLAETTHRSYNGYAIATTRYNDRLVDGLTITAIGASCSQDDWREIIHWIKARSTVWLLDLTTSFTATDYPVYSQYMGKVISTNYLGNVGKNSNRNFIIEYAVDSEVSRGKGIDY